MPLLSVPPGQGETNGQCYKGVWQHIAFNLGKGVISHPIYRKGELLINIMFMKS